jgi:hypothetical protein
MGPVVPSAWPKVPGGTCHTPRWAWDLYGDYGGDYDFIWSYVWFFYDFIWSYNILMMYTAVLVGGFCDILMITQHFWLGLPSGNQTWQGEVYYHYYSLLFSHWNLNFWGISQLATFDYQRVLCSSKWSYTILVAKPLFMSIYDGNSTWSKICLGGLPILSSTVTLQWGPYAH